MIIYIYRKMQRAEKMEVFMQNILIVGASGLIGSGIIEALKSEKVNIRTTTGKKENASKDKVFLNLATGEGIDRAFEGIDKVFMLSPAGFANQHSVLSPLIKAAINYKLKKVVLMTAMGADAVETSPLRRTEIELEKSGLSYNIIRPNWFMQNFQTFWIHGINTANKILLPVGNAKTSFIDARDISAVAAKLLMTDEFNNKAFVLTGPEALDHDQVANYISEASGRNISYQEITPEELKPGLLGAGLPEDYSDFLLMILGAVKAGYNSPLTDNVKLILGRAPRNFKQYASDNRNKWIL